MNFDLSVGTLMAGMVVSSIGCGFFVYGKKQSRAPQLVAGVAMLALPMAIENPWAILGSGAAAIAAVVVAVRAGI